MNFESIKTISIVNQKGGVGKTTLAILLGEALIKKGYRVLFIDLDPSYSLSNLLLSEYFLTNKNTICQFLSGVTPIQETLTIVEEGYNIVRGDKKLKNLTEKLYQDKHVRAHILRKRIEKLNGQFDFCIIDTASSYDALMINALIAADLNILPVNPEYTVFCGLLQMIENITKLSLKQKLEYRILMNMHEKNIEEKTKVFSTMQKNFATKTFQQFISYDSQIKIENSKETSEYFSNPLLEEQLEKLCIELLSELKIDHRIAGRVVA